MNVKIYYFRARRWSGCAMWYGRRTYWEKLISKLCSIVIARTALSSVTITCAVNTGSAEKMLCKLAARRHTRSWLRTRGFKCSLSRSHRHFTLKSKNLIRKMSVGMAEKQKVTASNIASNGAAIWVIIFAPQHDLPKGPPLNWHENI